MQLNKRECSVWEQEHSGMEVDEEAGQEALENQSDLDQIKKSKGERHECPETAEDAGHKVV